MPLWKDGLLFDSSSKNATNDEPQSSCDIGNTDDNGVNKVSGIDADENLNINIVSLTVSTASPEATHVGFLGDKPEVDMSNINTTYQVPSTLNTRIHKDHSRDLVIGDVIEEEVYVCQPLGFEDLDHPNKFYKVVYVDEIIFGSTKKELCNEFKKLMKDKFQMSSMGELTFFLDVKTASTPVDTEKPLVKDVDGVDLDVHLYRSMIGSLMYLTASRPDITDSLFELVAYTDSDYARASLDRKSTTEGCQFLVKQSSMDESGEMITT
nr:hypothetical protein [Tanacetum cinerariifolium]